MTLTQPLATTKRSFVVVINHTTMSFSLTTPKKYNSSFHLYLDIQPSKLPYNPSFFFFSNSLSTTMKKSIAATTSESEREWERNNIKQTFTSPNLSSRIAVDFITDIEKRERESHTSSCKSHSSILLVCESTYHEL